MAQCKVTEFFNTRKKNADFQPSKRRKLALTETTDSTVHVDPVVQKSSPAVSARTRSRRQNLAVDLNPTPAEDATSKTKIEAPVKTEKAAPKTKRTAKATRKVGGRGKKKIDSTQKTIEDLFKKGKDCVEIPTAACDDHCASPPSSPAKRSQKSGSDDAMLSKKRSKQIPAARKDLMNSPGFSTPEKGYDFTTCPKTVGEEKSVNARKKLLLKKPVSPKQTKEIEKVREEDQEQKQEKQIEINKTTVKPVEKSIEENKQKSPVMEQPKQTLPPDPEKMKQKLAKCGKLADLKAQLAEFATAKEKVTKGKRKTKAAETSKPETAKPEKTAEKAPAYERFHHLATPVPASLSLPYKFKILEEVFQGMETVISMLHNRSEICTFDRLKPAVENLTRKQFEQRRIGQVVTVYDRAYILRQEKGLPVYGGKKTTGYQLTIEPNLVDLQVSANVENQMKSMNEANIRDAVNKGGRIKFSAAHCLERKHLFHRNLVEIVKQEHKNFLAKLDPPLSIPDDKLTRWHPKFQLDDIPAIEPAALPAAPDVKKLTTAAEILEHSTTKLNPRVKAALEKVANEKKPEESKERRNSVGNLTKEEKKATNNSSKPLTGLDALREKIKAKEAQKQAAVMMRSPEEEERLKRIGRLPEIVRILRTFYISQKRPSIIMESAVQTISDSYRSILGKAESEKHLKLALELIPEWITCVKISKGSFIKINKDKDINQITGKLQQILKKAK